MEEETHFTRRTAPEPVPHEASTNTLPHGVPPPIIPPTALHPLPIPDVFPPHAIAAIPPHVVPAGPPSQAVVMVLSGPSDVGLADAEQERQNRFEELASTLDRMIIDIQEAEERCEHNFRANEEEREYIFVENERRRDTEAEEWRKESMREAASRHAEDIREVIRLERESAQTERERAQERDQEERDRMHEEYQADIRALEDELDAVRKELEDEKMARWTKKAERHERGRAEMLEQNSRMHRNHFDNPIGLLFRRAWRKFRRDKWLDFHHLEKS